MHGATESTHAGGSRDDLGALLVRCGQGDRVAFASVYDAVADRAYGLSVRVLHDPAEAEAAVRAAFTDLWCEAGRFDPARNGGLGWILTVVHRTAVDRHRARSALDLDSETSEARGLDVDGGRAGEHVGQHLDGTRVRTALQRLSPIQRRAVELAYFEALTCPQIAAALGIPVGAARSRIRTGLTRLREECSPAA